LNSVNADGSDLFLELFANDFCRITSSIKMKRKQRGRDDMYENKLKALDMKISAVQNYYVRLMQKITLSIIEDSFFT
jgi:hypothetical protein